MMHDPLDPQEQAPTKDAEPRTPTPAEPVTDREVPLDATALPEAVHAFLDGEQVPDQDLSAAQRELDLWKRIAAETGRRRRMMTPAHVQQQILKKLTDD